MLVFTFIASLQRQIAEHPAKINSKTLASKYRIVKNFGGKKNFDE